MPLGVIFKMPHPSFAVYELFRKSQKGCECLCGAYLHDELPDAPSSLRFDDEVKCMVLFMGEKQTALSSFVLGEDQFALLRNNKNTHCWRT